MTHLSELEGLRRQLVDLLQAQLAEAEDDEARQAAWEATNWDLASGDPCPNCSAPTLRFVPVVTGALTGQTVCPACYRENTRQQTRKIERNLLVKSLREQLRARLP